MEESANGGIGFWQHSKMAIKYAFAEFGAGRDMALGTIIALITLGIQVRERLIPIADWQEHKKWWILSFVLPYIVVLGVHAIWRMLQAPWRLYRKEEIGHRAALTEVDDRCRKTVSALEETTRGTLAAAEEEHRKALQSAEDNSRSLRAELSATQQQLAALKRDWAGDWKELAGQFRELVKHHIWAQWNRTSAGESWDITGGGQEVIRRIESLCKHAGDLLLASPKVARSVAPELLSYLAARDRWLFYLKATTRAFRQDMGYGVETLPTGDKINLLFGTIPDLPEVAANACMECAGQEY